MFNFHKILCVILFFYSCNPKLFAHNWFSISGSIPIIYNGVEIKLLSDNPSFLRLSSKVKNGKFQFTSTLGGKYENVTLIVEKNNENLGWWTFFIKGEKMQIKILSLKNKSSENNIRYFNVPFIKEQKTFDSLIKPSQDHLAYAFNFMKDKGLESGYDKDSLTAVIRDLRVEILNKKIEFVKTYPNSYIALYIFNKNIVKYPLNDLIISPDSLMSIYSAFDKSLKETNLGKLVYRYLFKKQSLLINGILPNFSFLTNTAQHYKLSSFRNNKYILLCFWASWCSPCIKSIPVLKELSKKYEAKGLQLISVSLDNNEAKWLSSLQKYNLPWLQTCDLPAYVKGTSIKDLYDVHFIPQYFLINKEGRLLYQNVQLKDNDDYNILQKMLENLSN